MHGKIYKRHLKTRVHREATDYLGMHHVVAVFGNIMCVSQQPLLNIHWRQSAATAEHPWASVSTHC